MGAYLAILDQISAGMMIAASIITARALAPLEQTIASWRGLVAARQAKARLEATLNLSVRKKVKSLLPAPRDSLVIENLFSGPETGAIVLRGVSFNLKAGDGMGIVGPSGSGKTTLSRAILGIWPTLNGSIRLDGSTLDQWEPEAIGRSIGFLPQDVGLFDGTIGQNIARFDPDASSEAILNAARLAGVHDLIVQLPDGYDTLLGEGAHDLSAGQRQRVGLARALYGDPFLVVLDEPNANLDADGDALLSKAIASVRARGGIVLVIAHRPSALAAVDHLLMIKNGRQQAFGEKETVLGAIARNAEKLKSTIGLKVVEHGKA
jgi:ATP-binding cassette subfamily C protein